MNLRALSIARCKNEIQKAFCCSFSGNMAAMLLVGWECMVGVKAAKSHHFSVEAIVADVVVVAVVVALA